MVILCAIPVLLLDLLVIEKTGFCFDAAKFGLNRSNRIFYLFVFITDDGEGFNFAIGLIDEEAQVLADEVAVVDTDV